MVSAPIRAATGRPISLLSSARLSLPNRRGRQDAFRNQNAHDAPESQEELGNGSDPAPPRELSSEELEALYRQTDWQHGTIGRLRDLLA